MPRIAPEVFDWHRQHATRLREQARKACLARFFKAWRTAMGAAFGLLRRGVFSLISRRANPR